MSRDESVTVHFAIKLKSSKPLKFSFAFIIENCIKKLICLLSQGEPNVKYDRIVR